LSSNFPLVLIRGGGDLATGVATRLYRSGFGVVVTEVARPRAVRRLVAFAEAVFQGSVKVEGLHAVLVENPPQALDILDQGEIPVLIDPKASSRFQLHPIGLVDARMLKREVEPEIDYAPIVIGLGPGFQASVNCHAVIETNRGHHLGRVIWEGSAEADTGIPGPVAGHNVNRVLRAPAAGKVKAHIALGALVKKAEVIAEIEGVPLVAPFDGALRGLIHESVKVGKGEKIGDLDPRGVAEYCYEISDKSLAIGGGVLEALLSVGEIRGTLGS
jgi:xanthine dehydrogenase accessory factor